MRKIALAAAVALAAIAAPAAAQTLLDHLLAHVTKPRPGSEGTTANGAPAALASITAVQTAAIDRALAAPLQDTAVVADRAAAAPLLKALLATGSCARIGAGFAALSRRMVEPRNLDPYTFAAMPAMQYHDRATCLDVARVTDWRKPALNALAFTAYYVAPDSGEAAHQGFIVQKSTDGEWLIRTIQPTGR